MKLIFYFTALIIFLTAIVSALQFSPTTLEFNLEKNQVACKNIYFEIESQTTIKDAWAEDSSEQWSISNFKTSSRQLDLELSYPSQITPEQKEIQLCLSGSNPGNYRGAIIFRENEIGNSIVQFAVWLKVSISGETEEAEGESESGSSNGRSTAVYLEQSQFKENAQELSFEIPNDKIKLGSKTVEKKSSQIALVPIIISVIIFLIVFLLILISLLR